MRHKPVLSCNGTGFYNVIKIIMFYSLFSRKFIALSIAFMLVVPGFYTAVRTQKAMAKGPLPVVCINCYHTPTSLLSLGDQFINTAKSIITSIQTTIIAVKTTYLALKEAVLDPIARLLSALLSNSLVQMMFSFLGAGNNGAPAFVTNPKRYFESVANESTNVFLTDLLNNRPDRMASINRAVRQRIIEENYVDRQRLRRSTFPGGDAGYQAYINDPSKCPTGNSWDCYFATVEPQNDPYQVYQFEREQLEAKRGTDVRVAEDEFLAGSGYHSLKDCIEKDDVAKIGPLPGDPDFIGPLPDKTGDSGKCYGGPCLSDDILKKRKTCFDISLDSDIQCNFIPAGTGEQTKCKDAARKAEEVCLSGVSASDTSTVPGSSSFGGGPRGGNCTAYLTKTPGAAISGQVDEYLSNALKLLQAADEVDEVITVGMRTVQGWMNGKGLTSLGSGSRNIDYSARNPDGSPRYVSGGCVGPGC
jgi:hypothetical protein